MGTPGWPGALSHVGPVGECTWWAAGWRASNQARMDGGWAGSLARGWKWPPTPSAAPLPQGWAAGAWPAPSVMAGGLPRQKVSSAPRSWHLRKVAGFQGQVALDGFPPIKGAVSRAAPSWLLRDPLPSSSLPAAPCLSFVVSLCHPSPSFICSLSQVHFRAGSRERGKAPGIWNQPVSGSNLASKI